MAGCSTRRLTTKTAALLPLFSTYTGLFTGQSELGHVDCGVRKTNLPSQPSSRNSLQRGANDAAPRGRQGAPRNPRGPFDGLTAIAAPLLQLQANERDRAAEMRLHLAIKAHADVLMQKPPDAERTESFAELQRAVANVLGQLVARGVRLGPALGEIQQNLAQCAEQGPPALDAVAAASPERGRSTSRGGAVPPPPRTGALGHRLQRTEARRPTPRRSAPQQPLPELPPGSLGRVLNSPGAPLELDLGKHKLDARLTAAHLPELFDWRTQTQVQARASLLAIDNGDVLLLTSMATHGTYGKLRPALVLRTNEEVVIKDMRRVPSRRPNDPSRLGRQKTDAPYSVKAQRTYDLQAKEELELMVRFGGRARGIRLHQGDKSNFLIMRAMDCELFSPFAKTPPEVRSALARRLAPALLRQLANMHAKGWVHLDVKMNNALIHLESGDVALADFGAAHQLKGTSVDLPQNPSSYPPPEVRARPAATSQSASSDSDDEDVSTGVRHSAASDVWGAGVSILNMLDHERPASETDPFFFTVFSGANYAAWYREAVHNGAVDFAFLERTPANVFTRAFARAAFVDLELTRALYLGPLAANPQRRPDASQLAATLARVAAPTRESEALARGALEVRARRQADSSLGKLRGALGTLRNTLLSAYPQLREKNMGLS